jgi:putative transcriptional regulator
MSHYHPDELMLMNYAAGNLPTAEALIISVHLASCHQCQTYVRQTNLLGGVLFEKITPATDDKLDDVDAFIAALPDRKNNLNGKNSSTPSGYRNPLGQYLPDDLRSLAWKKQTNTISKFDLNGLVGEKGANVTLQKISAGARVPKHTHKGTEYTLILSGGFSDELGVYHQGDFISRDASHKHSPTALQNEDCICLTVLDAPIRFTGWMRILNPFLS